MFSAASPLSIKGALESMLTWTGSKTSRPAPEDKTWQRNKDIFSIIVTPDRIPKFCIPSLEVDHLVTENDREESQHEQSPRSRLPGKTIQRYRPIRSKSELCIRKEDTLSHATWVRRETLCLTDANLSSEHLERAGDHSDPVTRAALSLPHLPKITTPYGFLTLGESPNIRRKESLFFGYGSAELRILISQKKEAACLAQHSINLLTVHNQPRTWEKPSSKNPWFVSSGKHGNKQTPPPLHYGLTPERGTSKCERKRFYLLMKRHLPTIKRLSSSRTSADKLMNQAEKSLSSSIS